MAWIQSALRWPKAADKRCYWCGHDSPGSPSLQALWLAVVHIRSSSFDSINLEAKDCEVCLGNSSTSRWDFRLLCLGSDRWRLRPSHTSYCLGAAVYQFRRSQARRQNGIIVFSLFVYTSNSFFLPPFLAARRRYHLNAITWKAKTGMPHTRAIHHCQAAGRRSPGETWFGGTSSQLCEKENKTAPYAMHGSFTRWRMWMLVKLIFLFPSVFSFSSKGKITQRISLL